MHVFGTSDMGSKEMNGRDNILVAMARSFSVGTVRHVQTNMVVDVINEAHAVARWYATIYGSHGVGTASPVDPLSVRPVRFKFLKRLVHEGNTLVTDVFVTSPVNIDHAVRNIADLLTLIRVALWDAQDRVAAP